MSSNDNIPIDNGFQADNLDSTNSEQAPIPKRKVFRNSPNYRGKENGVNYTRKPSPNKERNYELEATLNGMEDICLESDTEKLENNQELPKNQSQDEGGLFSSNTIDDQAIKKDNINDTAQINIENIEDNQTKEEFSEKNNYQQEIVKKGLIEMNYLRSLSIQELINKAREYDINTNRMTKQEMIYYIVRALLRDNYQIRATGVLEMSNDISGFLRSVDNNYFPSIEDIFIGRGVIRRATLRPGDQVCCLLANPKGNERHFAVDFVEKVNDLDIIENGNSRNFNNLVPLHPDKKIIIDCNIKNQNGVVDVSTRIIDLFAPIGKGQRALIVAPPKVGKTVLLQNLARAITDNNPEIKLIMLLIDERPEEMTDMQRSVKGEVVGSTFDRPASDHVMLSRMVIERAKRMVECGHDVVVLLDSITRLARAYNTTVPSSGKVLSGGVDSNALQQPKRFFGSARNIENGGSLTIIATALIDTGSKMDDVIFEEFKGTGNSEIVLERKLAEKRIFPAINIDRSSTRKDDHMVSPDLYNRFEMFRRIVSQMTENSGLQEAVNFVITKVKATENNIELLNNMNSR